MVQCNKDGLLVLPKNIVHDSSTNEIMIEDIFKISDAYYTHFYKFMRENYQQSFPFDLDISLNWRDKCSLSKDGNVYKIKGESKSVEYFYDILSKLDEVKSHELKIVTVEEVDVLDQQMRSLVRSHNYTYNYGFNNNSTSIAIFELNI